MSDKTSLGDRMKGYEAVPQTKLLRRTPVIIRVDGKAFHTYTKRFNKSTDPSMEKGPFSELLHKHMMFAVHSMVREIQNAKIAYFQSDEISILLNDWSELNTQQWFDGKIQKIVSVSAAMAAVYFNYAVNCDNKEGRQSLALFDSRVFNLPPEEVTNYFIWRQQDATRNSVNMLGRFYYSQKALHGKTTDQVQEMVWTEFGMNWNDLDVWKKRGACIRYNDYTWMYDDETPIFTQDRSYIERYLI